MGQGLPLSTRITLTAADWLVWGVPILVIALVVFFALKDQLLSERAKEKLDGWR